ncbi:hypothetical protein [Bradyrhizobium roseum]|uniref:hypothetical protein n=1 Tax=Bradyrhizobium roseum TaxID=3056648 RepID=UPI0026130E01|nr:hypothetical protein [Bradyrhizobium roseus]WKA31605.1 hypothetical protein QUH67_16225 [Bradyrhizobium roseus]
MAFVPMSHAIGMPPIDQTLPAFTGAGRSAPWKIGDIIKAVDPVLGVGEFIYLQGLASTAVSEMVIYDHNAGTTKRAVAGDRGPCAFAMSANVASQFGWYQITGLARVKAGTVAANGALYATATPGTVDDAVVAGDKVDGARFKTADGTPAAGFAYAMLDRPALNGNG